MGAEQGCPLLPLDLVARARSQTRLDFTRAIGAGFLLIRVDDPSTDLAAGLSEGWTMSGELLTPTNRIGYTTSIAAPPRPRNGARGRFDVTTVRSLLAEATHFAVPLRKRPGSGKPFAGRISVGRAFNNDIVLRDPSVSKFHAWFECDEDREFYLGDGRSTNKTIVNGNRIGAAMERLCSGDEIRFGTIETILCPADVLWSAIVESA